MKHPAGARGHRERQAGGADDGVHPVRAAGAADLSRAEQVSEDEKRVLDCLQSAKVGLTLRQIQDSVPCSPDTVRAAVDSLLERRLACELNTVVPSYACRYPGISLYP